MRRYYLVSYSCRISSSKALIKIVFWVITGVDTVSETVSVWLSSSRIGTRVSDRLTKSRVSDISFRRCIIACSHLCLHFPFGIGGVSGCVRECAEAQSKG